MAPGLAPVEDPSTDRSSTGLARRMWSQPGLRASATVGLIGLAYHYSLLALGRGLTSQTPLAYLGIVPVIAVCLAWLLWSAGPALRPIHDRQVDLIVGAALIFVAGALAVLLPATLETRFWLYRVDVVTMPLFVAGIVTLFYGVRRLWQLKIPILFLLLAWPAIYAPVIGDGMRASVEWTIQALIALSGVLPFARPSGEGAEGIFWVNYAPEPFVLAVASACSGINSVVGFALIGTALTAIVRGSMKRRIGWLAAGLGAIWLLNVTRIQLIFVAGALYGRDAAMDVLHPVAGLIVFNLGVIIMLLLTRPFGLSFLARQTRSPAPDERSRGGRIGVLAVSLGVGAAVFFGAVNAGYARYDMIADGVGQARLSPLPTETSQLDGWDLIPVRSFDHGAPFFGPQSTWERLRYVNRGDAPLQSSETLYMDVITTQDANALISYGLDECYTFHNYTIEGRASAALGHGVSAELLSYVNPRYDNLWTVLKWELPYRADDGATWFQRVVLMIPRGTEAELDGVLANDFESSNPDLRAVEAFLVAMARELVEAQVRLGRVA